MDQVQHRALEALQPFIALTDSKNAQSPRYIANIITNATSSPQTYVFAELLEQPAVQALRSPDTDTPPELRGYLTLLEIFAWGTWRDYTSTPNLPTLSPDQARKLRLLTLLSLASSTSAKPLTYELLMDELALTEQAELESLVTAAVYSSLITARLSPATAPPTVNVTSVAPLRDVKPASLPSMISTLTAWQSRCGSVISDIEAEIAKIRAGSAQRRTKEHARSAVLEKALENFESQAEQAGAFGGAGGAGGKRTGWKPRDIGAAFRNQNFFGGGSNKREFDDDGYFDNGGIDFDTHGSGMDIDEGAGARAGRQSKRFLGKKS